MYKRNPSRNGIFTVMPTTIPNPKDCLGQTPNKDQINLTHCYGLVTIILMKLNGCQLVSQDLKGTCQEIVGKIQGRGITTNQELLSNFTLINTYQQPLLLQVWEENFKEIWLL